MPNASARPRMPHDVTRTLVCVDGERDGDYFGTVYNPYLPGTVSFDQVKEILIILEDFFGDIAFPQPYYQCRSFFERQAQPRTEPMLPQRHSETDVLDYYRGTLATFVVDVQHRRAGTWQGKILWAETGKSKSFHSVLEMLKLIDLAVRQSEGHKTEN